MFGCPLTGLEVYRLALRMPSLNLPDSQSAQVGSHRCHMWKNFEEASWSHHVLSSAGLQRLLRRHGGSLPSTSLHVSALYCHPWAGLGSHLRQVFLARPEVYAAEQSKARASWMSCAGFYMAIGTSGNQFKNAGVVGRLMRELIEASRTCSSIVSISTSECHQVVPVVGGCPAQIYI